jgi:hypothetical protein
VRSLALREFQNLEIPQARVSVADPAQYDLKNNTYPEAAWSALHVNGLLTLSPAGADPPTVTIRPAGAEHSLLAIHDIYASSGAEITVASPEKDNVTLRLRGVRQFGTVGLPAEFQLVADSCQATAAAWPSHHPSVTLELQLSGPRRTLEFKGPGTGVLMALEYPAGHTAPVLKPDFAVDQVEFLDLGKTGQPQSTLSGAGTPAIS